MDSDFLVDKFNNGKTLFKIAFLALGFRVAVYLLYYFLMIMFCPDMGAIGFETYLNGWERWDANAYLNVAEYGYLNYEEAGEHLYLVFLPLYPWLVRLFGLLISDLRIAGMLISTVSSVVGSVYLYQLVKEDYGEDAALGSVLMLSVFPFSFFMGGILTDALFFALAVMFLYYLKKQNYLLVSVLGFLCCLTKLQGGFLAFVVLIELACSSKVFSLLKARDFKSVWSRFLLPGFKCVPMLSGIGVYLWINFLVEGDAFVFMRYQSEHWSHSVGPIWNTVKYMFKYALDNPTGGMALCIWWPQIILLVLQIAAVIYGVIIKFRPSYITYIAVFCLVTYSSTWLISGARYTIASVPLFILLGIAVSKMRPGLRNFIYCTSFGLLLIYSLGYIKWMEIM